MTDDLDALARLVHETRHEARAGLDRPFIPEPWEKRPEVLRDVDRAIAAAVRDAVLSHPAPYGPLVRETWIRWAVEQPDVAEHQSWTKPWDELAWRDQEVDERIASAVAAQAVHDAGLAPPQAEVALLRMKLAAIRDLCDHPGRLAPAEVQRKILEIIGTEPRQDGRA